MEALQSKLCDAGNWDFTEHTSRIRCMAHILHLVVMKVYYLLSLIISTAKLSVQLLSVVGVAREVDEETSGYQENICVRDEEMEAERRDDDDDDDDNDKAGEVDCAEDALFTVSQTIRRV